MARLRFRPVDELREAIDDAFARETRRIRRMLPSAEIEEMGASAIPGSITKGDLDLLVRVAEEQFADAVLALRQRFEVHQPGNWTTSYASFKDERPKEVPVGVQLVVAESSSDIAFVSIRELLRARADLVERMNELKRSHEGGDPDAYVAAKGAFIESLLRRA